MTLQAIRNEATLHAPVPLASLTGEAPTASCLPSTPRT